jgi:hypothetical protein
MTIRLGVMVVGLVVGACCGGLVGAHVRAQRVAQQQTLVEAYQAHLTSERLAAMRALIARRGAPTVRQVGPPLSTGELLASLVRARVGLTGISQAGTTMQATMEGSYPQLMRALAQIVVALPHVYGIDALQIQPAQHGQVTVQVGLVP